MERSSYPWEKERRQDGLNPRLAVLVGIVVIAAAAVAVLFPPIEATNTGIPVSRKVSQLVYPATVVSEVSQPEGGEWLLPSGLVNIGDYTFVLDTGNDRILKLDGEGRVLATLDSTSDSQLRLDQPMAISTDGSRLFVANSLAGEVLALDVSGTVESIFPLQAEAGDNPPRPIGIAARADGSLVVSDAENHRVLFLDSAGQVVRSVGSGMRSGGSNGFNVPAALTLDEAGNVYVVDTLNGRVVKLSGDGVYLAEFGKLADTAGSLARPKGLAVDAAGRVLVSDGLQAAISVFGADGTYLGVIGRRDPQDAKAGSVFEAPSALWLSGNRLMVVDAVAGLVTLDLSESQTADSRQ